MIQLSFFVQYLLPVIVLASIGIFFGILIAILSKVLYVKEDTRVAAVTSLLPGYNCGMCGHPGCSGLADAIVNKNAPISQCKPIRPNQIEAIREFLKQQENTNTSH